MLVIYITPMNTVTEVAVFRDDNEVLVGDVGFTGESSVEDVLLGAIETVLDRVVTRGN